MKYETLNKLQKSAALIKQTQSFVNNIEVFGLVDIMMI